MQENKPEISVLMAVYDGQAYLAEAIDSIMQQSFTDFEFIIINDGSTDDTEKIILSYKDTRIVYIDNATNVGLIESLNRGLQYSKGKYIARMDADDIAIKDRFKQQIEVFKKNEKAVVVGTDYFSFSQNSKSLNQNINDSDYLKTLLLFGPCFCHPTVMIKNIFKEKKLVYNRNYLHAEDYKLWTDLASIGDFVIINEPLLNYRSHENQISNLKRMEQLRKCAAIRTEYLNALGIPFDEKQFRIHCLIADNTFIRSKTELKAIEDWLLYLLNWNNESKIFNIISFNRCINKIWADSCGYTNLGLYAFNYYFKSALSKIYDLGFKEKSLLFVKGVYRRFK